MVHYAGTLAGGIILSDLTSILREMSLGFPDINPISVFFLSQDFLNKFQRAKDAMEYARKSAAESATATVSEQ